MIRNDVYEQALESARRVLQDLSFGAAAPAMSNGNGPTEHNRAYEQLVSGDDDLIGLIAYALYKKDKRDFYHRLAGAARQRAADRPCARVHRDGADARAAAALPHRGPRHDRRLRQDGRRRRKAADRKGRGDGALRGGGPQGGGV